MLPLPYNEDLYALVSAVNERLTESVHRVQAPLLREALAHVVQGGKRIRPLLCMLACSSAGGDPRRSLDVAAAIELLHTASLVHDDLMDQSPLRRGVPTLQTLYDVPTAILSGDALIALAFDHLRGVRVPARDRIEELFTAAFRELCEGQALELQYTGSEESHTTLPYRVARKKTASLLRAACEMGALHATPDEATLRGLADFGYCLGMAFQAQDDILDVAGNEEEMGKPTLLDRKNGRLTFATPCTACDCEPAQYAVQRYTDDAVRALENVPPSVARDQLVNIALALMGRRL